MAGLHVLFRVPVVGAVIAVCGVLYTLTPMHGSNPPCKGMVVTTEASPSQQVCAVRTNSG